MMTRQEQCDAIKALSKRLVEEKHTYEKICRILNSPLDQNTKMVVDKFNSVMRFMDRVLMSSDFGADASNNGLLTAVTGLYDTEQIIDELRSSLEIYLTEQITEKHFSPHLLEEAISCINDSELQHRLNTCLSELSIKTVAKELTTEDLLEIIRTMQVQIDLLEQKNDVLSGRVAQLEASNGLSSSGDKKESSLGKMGLF